MHKQTPEPELVIQALEQTYPGKSLAEPLGKAVILAALSAVHAAEDSRRPLLERMQPGGDKSSKKLVPGQQQSAMLSWVDAAFRLMLTEHPLDEALTARTKKLLPVVAAVALLEPDFLSVGIHPLQRLVDTIYSGCLGWHGRLGRSGEAVLAELDKILDIAGQYFANPDMDFSGQVDNLSAFFEAESKASERMRERVVASEQGKLKAASARITAGTALNELMDKQVFSAAMVDFMIGPWYDSMQRTLITEGPESKNWERMLTVTRTLVWTVQPLDTTEDGERQRLYKVIPLIPQQLEGLLVSLEHAPAEKKQAIAVVEDAHFQLLRNRPPKQKPFEPILLGSSSAHTSVTEHMLAQIKPLQTGQWFKISAEEGPNLRVQLALKIDDYHQLLFVNRSGVKAVQKSFEEFAYLLSSGVARPCSAAPALTLSLLKVLDIDTEDTRAGQRGTAGKENKWADLSPRVQELRKKRERERAEASANSDSADLAIGSWLKFSDGDEPLLCKLAVRIDGLDKWLFVNERGVRQRELSSSELDSLRESGHCELVSSESVFEKSVLRLMRDFRDPGNVED